MGFIDNIKQLFTRRGLNFSATLGADSNSKFSDVKLELDKFVDTIDPKFPLDFIELIKKLAIITPDVSQAIKRSVLLGNTGLTFHLEGASESVQESAQVEIKDFLSKQPGIINKLYRQVVIGGAISAEAIPSLAIDEVEEIRVVPVGQIRFKKSWIDSERYKLVPCQLGEDGNLHPLNLEQYIYEAIETDEDSPYGIPPFISMLRHVLLQSGATESVQNMLNQMGMMGFIDVSKKSPHPKVGEDPGEYQNRLMSILKDLRNNIAAKIKSGILVHFSDTETKHTNVTSDMRGFEKVNQAIEEQTASGLDIDPALLGRTYSTTETYAGVVFTAFIEKLSSYGQVVENAMKKFLTLHLRARGYKFTRLHAEWGTPASIDKKKDAEARKIDIETEQAKFTVVMAKLNAGLIEADDAAKELGYDTWSDLEKLESNNTENADGQNPAANVLSFDRDSVKKKSAA